MVYDFLLTPAKGSKNAERITCHPSIVASCKKVNEEANNMLMMLYQDQKISLHIALKLHDEHYSTRFHGATVYLNRRLLGRDYQVKWPHFMTRHRFMTVNLVTHQLSERGLRKRHQMFDAGSRQVNHVVYTLYRMLHNGNHLQELKVHIDGRLNIAWSRSALKILAAISALTALVETSFIVSHERNPLHLMAIELRAISAAFRKIHKLKHEELLHRELTDEWACKHPVSTYFLDQQLYRVRDALAQYEAVTSASQRDSLDVFATSEEVTKAIVNIEHALDEIEDKEFEERRGMSNEVKRLRDMRALRRAEAGAGQSE